MKDYTDKNTSLLLGDSLTRMRELKSKIVDVIICDLPYGTTACKWDSIIPFKEMWAEYNRICKGSIVLFASQPFTAALIASNLKQYRYSWVWKKNFSTNFLHAKRMPLRNTEDICVFGRGTYNPQKTKGHKPTQSARGASEGVLYHGKNVRNYVGGDTERFPTTILEFDAHDPKNRVHPTQKSLALCEYLILTYSNEGDVVLDNTMGSGTTGVAARRLNRNFIGIEQDKKFFGISKHRILNCHAEDSSVKDKSPESKIVVVEESAWLSSQLIAHRSITLSAHSLLTNLNIGATA